MEGATPKPGWIAGSKIDMAPHDPWKHRSSNMLCQTCMYFVPKRQDMGEQTRIGRCRRHAPTMSGYPAVFPVDWCGDHKLDENKL